MNAPDQLRKTARSYRIDAQDMRLRSIDEVPNHDPEWWYTVYQAIADGLQDVAHRLEQDNS